MTDTNMSFFEGTEKLLEIWFGSSKNQSTADLRLIPRNFWDDLLDLVQCKILSHVKNESIHAYVLSESSMFVSKNRFILKTCGTTTLLYAIQPLLKKVKEYCGFDIVEDVFYSRKKFMQPHLQEKLHQSFEDEVEYLNQLFSVGGAYVLGKLNADAWYLYTINPRPTFGGVMEPDQTLELLLSDLDPKIMGIFTAGTNRTAAQATAQSGIADLFPAAIIDDYLFDPCGYSMNGLLPDGHYITIHITPEPECSYVSFETNVPQADYHDLIMQVLNCFKPGKFLLTVFANKASVASGVHKEMQCEKWDEFAGFAREDHQLCKFKNYSLTYAHFARDTF